LAFKSLVGCTHNAVLIAFPIAISKPMNPANAHCLHNYKDAGFIGLVFNQQSQLKAALVRARPNC